MKMYVPMSDIRIVEEPSEKENSKKEERNPSSKSSGKNQQRANAGVGLSKAAGIKTEIDLRGMTSEEALGAVDKYIDDAVMAGLNMCYIIHGKGTGKLRSEIHGMLRHDKRIKSFRLGEYGEGDSGVTVAEFK